MDTYINDLIDRAARFWEHDEALPLDLLVEMDEAGIEIEKAQRQWVEQQIGE